MVGDVLLIHISSAVHKILNRNIGKLTISNSNSQTCATDTNMVFTFCQIGTVMVIVPVIYRSGIPLKKRFCEF